MRESARRSSAQGKPIGNLDLMIACIRGGGANVVRTMCGTSNRCPGPLKVEDGSEVARVRRTGGYAIRAPAARDYCCSLTVETKQRPAATAPRNARSPQHRPDAIRA